MIRETGVLYLRKLSNSSFCSIKTIFVFYKYIHMKAFFFIFHPFFVSIFHYIIYATNKCNSQFENPDNQFFSPKKQCGLTRFSPPRNIKSFRLATRMIAFHIYPKRLKCYCRYPYSYVNQKWAGKCNQICWWVSNRQIVASPDSPKLPSSVCKHSWPLAVGRTWAWSYHPMTVPNDL